MRGATLRSIAARAGVSPALVQHHFGTKERLRAACDAHVLDYVRDEATAVLERAGLSDPDHLAEAFRSGPRIQRYLARALVDDSTNAAALFDDLVGLTAHHLAESSEAASEHHDRAVVLTAMRLGVLVLHEHVSRGLGADVFADEAATRVARASLDVLDPALLPEGAAGEALAGLAAHDRRTHQHQEDQ